ncbi:ABC transporter ATP-binding protein [Lacticaseibacillus brantae]|uniref:ABC transporter ATP-binding protein n=1 Tax=Lacticaseibacillus brantae DSM 23927 TaxID=1423727 RepID=A0A0R2B151_9LACO|nr:ABC transporter ATP-binding protein [Lacticaseibacillus brantae]KRM72482.1 ABC transporter ATP-binding protein [Lacticaseibacillus brantae DSM 23927]
MSLVIKGLGTRIGQQQILTDINVDLHPGEIVGLIGRNGVGKTTFFKTILHQYLPNSGEIQIDGTNVTQDPSVFPRVFYLDDQNLYFAHESIRFAAQFAAMVYPDFDGDTFWRLMAANKLLARQPYRFLSRGLKAYVRVSLAVASGSPYVLLDEPFEGLDIIVREQILQLIVQEVADHQRSFLLASHDLDELDGLSDRVYMLKDGQIAGTYDLESLRQHAQKLQLAFKADQLPEIAHQGQVISHRGRVYEILFSNYSDAIDAALRAGHPILMEPMSLTLTDLFKMNQEDNQ